MSQILFEQRIDDSQNSLTSRWHFVQHESPDNVKQKANSCVYKVVRESQKS